MTPDKITDVTVTVDDAIRYLQEARDALNDPVDHAPGDITRGYRIARRRMSNAMTAITMAMARLG